MADAQKGVTVAEDFRHERAGIAVDDGISGMHMTRLLDRGRFASCTLTRRH